MENKGPQSLAGQEAQIIVSKDEKYTITFGPDVHLIWESGVNLNSSEKPAPHPEITGSVMAEKDTDYSGIQDAELILGDGAVFKISFVSKTYFSAHESVNSRTHVYSD